MIINQTHGFIYIHIPKCGGTSVTEYLSQYTTWRDVEIGATTFGEAVQASYLERFNMRKHIPAFHLRAIVGNETWESYCKISTVRSPYSRFLSIFNFLTRSPTYSDNVYVKYIKSFPDINAFIREGDFLNDKVPDYMFLPQVYWLGNSEDFCESTEIIMDKIVKLEEIDELTHFMSEKCDLERGVIPISNATDYGLDILNDESIIALQKIYSQDFDMLGYKKIIGS
jgi:hypothetical protein